MLSLKYVYKPYSSIFCYGTAERSRSLTSKPEQSCLTKTLRMCIFGKWLLFVFVCGYVCLSACMQAFLLIRTRGYSELCFALILCRSLFMEIHTPTRIHTDNQCAKTTLHQRTWTSLFVTTDEKQGLQGQQMDRNMCAHTSKCLLLHGQRSFGHRSETVPPSMLGWIWLQLVHTGRRQRAEPEPKPLLCLFQLQPY